MINTSIPASNCPKCFQQVIGGEIYTINTAWGPYDYDIDYARHVVNDGRAAQVLTPELHKVALSYIEAGGIVESHLEHLTDEDLKTPGIIIEILDPNKELQWQLIDGGHRATRLWREQREFLAYQMNWVESERCLLIYKNPQEPVNPFFPVPDGVTLTGVQGRRGQCIQFHHPDLGKLGRIFWMQVGPELFQPTYELDLAEDEKIHQGRLALFTTISKAFNKYIQS